MSINILDELKQDFLVYAQEVNNNRAFPDARDGLKISQRAVLWEMFDKKYTSNKPHVKSAKVDGGVIANWHPHGSEYSTIVRMSQPWVNNIPEINFHGANGSLVGGPDAAASRYTECRLAPASEDGFFSAINKNQVDFIKNYSEDLTWPSIFPAIFPRLFVNGSQGIGYTIAQEWEPGNLIEFLEKVKQYIDKNKITYDNIYPDYPTGGVIINKSDVHTIYETGKGSVILRGKTEIEADCINITELPYQVYAEPFIQKIKDLVNAGTLSGIEDICNKSGDDGLFIEIECSDDPKIVLNKLYKYTDLQVTFSANQMALVDGIPQMLNLLDYIKVYANHNISCLKREYQFDLDKAIARKEVVDGLVRAISIVDEIIATIRASKSSEDAKNNLISKYNFTENQAKAIVDLKLGKLANLEIVELNKELTDLIKIIDNCNKFLTSDKLQKKEFIKRLEEFTKNYGWTRRTEVIDVDLDAEKAEIKKSSTQTAEEYMICLTKGNNLKKIAISNYKSQTKVLSDADIIVSAIKLNNKERFVLISATGQMYKLQVNKLDLCNMNSSGTPISTFINDKIIEIYREDENKEFLILITKNGIIKKQDAKTVLTLSKVIGAPIMKLDEDDEIIYSLLVNNGYVLKYKLGSKEKDIKIDDLISKGRSSGGIVGIHLTKKLTTFELLN